MIGSMGNYWVPNISGGLVISKIPQRTTWDRQSQLHYTQTAEKVGVEYLHESVSFSHTIPSGTEEVQSHCSFSPRTLDTILAAKQIASIDSNSNGRIAVDVVSGQFKGEFTAMGQWWLEYWECYRCSDECIRCLRGIRTAPEGKWATLSGDFHRYTDYQLSPKPLDGIRGQIEDVQSRAANVGREEHLRSALNGLVIEIQGNMETVANLSNKTGMQATSKFNDLAQYNDRPKTKLIGTEKQVAERIVLMKISGINLVLTAFLHYGEEFGQFGRTVLSLVRELELAGRGKDSELEIQQTGDVYKKRQIGQSMAFDGGRSCIASYR
ncbi:methanesulfonate monooxygenase [Xylariales sp. AK1849]|nr:methanesulfonate monooxygenase [Xylariales sp. AK1849]